MQLKSLRWGLQVQGGKWEQEHPCAYVLYSGIVLRAGKLQMLEVHRSKCLS